MKTFEIYTKSSKAPIAVKLGWSWPGLFFGQFWLIFKGLWAFLFLSFVAIVIFYVVLHELLPELYYSRTFQTTFTIFYLCICGAKGNTIRANTLLKKGYEMSSIINATNHKLAILEFEKSSTDEKTKEPQESVVSKNKDLVKRKIKESIPSIKKKKSDYAKELQEAKDLLNDDLINEEDFEKIKKKIIDNL